VRVLFERGQFLPADTMATAAALQCYAVGLVGYSAARIASPVFYAIGQSRVPVAAGTASIAFNIVASVALIGLAGFRGLALATSLAALANGGLLLWLLKRRLHGIDGARLASTFGRVLIASLAMAAVAQASQRALTAIAPAEGLLTQASQLAASILAGLVALVVAARILNVQELTESMALVRALLRKLLAPG
jgi:putative peptidoglycan lipid II flippase